jgi:hypothetical protein
MASTGIYEIMSPEHHKWVCEIQLYLIKLTRIILHDTSLIPILASHII